VAQPGVDGLPLLERELQPRQPLAALDPEQVAHRWFALQPTVQHGVDLLLCACARLDELLASREPASHHPATLVRHPHRLQLAAP